MHPTRRHARFAVFAALITALLSASAAATGSPAGTLRVKPVEIHDFNGFGGPVVAFRGLVPHDWQTQGGVTWDAQNRCQGMVVRHEWAAFSPDGLTGIEVMPQVVWQMSNLPPEFATADSCPNLQITSARAYAEQLVASRRPGARLLDYRDRPDRVAASGFQPMHDQTAMSDLRMWLEAGDALIGYTYQGRPIREVVQIAVQFYHSRTAGAMPGQTMEVLSGTAWPSFAMRAPDGALDFQLADTLNSAIQIDPAYEQQMAAHHRKMNQINAKGAADVAEITRQGNAEVARIRNETYAGQQASNDRSHDAFVRTMREVDLYADPVAGPVELPSHYERAWRLDNGDYLLSNDHMLDPYGDLGVSGTLLEQTR
jgi:hypothetical protein